MRPRVIDTKFARGSRGDAPSRRITLTCNEVETTHEWISPTLPLSLDVATIMARGRPFDRLVGLHIRFKCTNEMGLPLRRDAMGVYLRCNHHDDPSFCHNEHVSDFYLGPAGGNGSEAMVFVDPAVLSTSPCSVPWTLLMKPFLNVRAAPEVSEMLLGEAIEATLTYDECLGSLSIDTVQNRVNTLPFYRRALNEKSRGNRQFLMFLRRHQRVTGKWILFQYQPDELAFFTTKHDGIRLTLLTRRHDCLEADMVRETVMLRAMRDFREEYGKLRKHHKRAFACELLTSSSAFLTLREYKYCEVFRHRAMMERRSLVLHSAAPVLMSRYASRNPEVITDEPNEGSFTNSSSSTDRDSDAAPDER